MATRPTDLDPLFQSAETLPGIGPKLSRVLRRLVPNLRENADVRVVDLLFHLPVNLIDRRERPGISGARPGRVVTLEVTIDEHRPPPRGNRRAPYRVAVHDETGALTLVFFKTHGDYLAKLLPIGETRFISGKVEDYGGFLQMPHPDHMLSAAEFDALPIIEPVYPMTAGLSQKVFARSVRSALELLPDLPEWSDPALIEARGWPSFHNALHKLHLPADGSEALPEHPARMRLAYDELLAGQIALSLVRERVKKAKGHVKLGTGNFSEPIREALPFELTDAQNEVLSQIRADLAGPQRMARLLQGDVGSGKTVVGLLAAATAAEAGFQTALMAPTEILARQHYATLQRFAATSGMKVAILTGQEKGAVRKEVLDGLANGSIDLVAGTHALFQDSVSFSNLGLVIIDEQHRFGVHQRLALMAKGDQPDLLAMTATPIPRTLVMTYFGDMDVSKLTGKPAGRKPVETATLSFERIGDLVDRLKLRIAAGEKVYWVCPLVEENEELDFTAAEERFEALGKIFPNDVVLVHGRMSGAEKDAAMDQFKNGPAKVLVATTVIEVGVDVPDATIIIIEHAERFGLSQLHQLRGRVGRGDRASSCVLLYKGPLGEVAKRRLEVMKETEDGFVIAEEDLKLRGEGDLLGTKQSGMPGFRLADMAVHGDLLAVARDDARAFLSRDRALKTPRGEAVRRLLYLFDRDEAIRLLRAG
ncbi:MAG: ATP-dependent DNA helicase RecG [Pseudomonadota bacterium]